MENSTDTITLNLDDLVSLYHPDETSITIPRFHELITDDVVNAFNAHKYTPEVISGIVLIYDKLGILYENIYPRCTYGSYFSYRNWKAPQCMIDPHHVDDLKRYNLLTNDNIYDYIENDLIMFVDTVYLIFPDKLNFIMNAIIEEGKLFMLQYFVEILHSRK